MHTCFEPKSKVLSLTPKEFLSITQETCTINFVTKHILQHYTKFYSSKHLTIYLYHSTNFSYSLFSSPQLITFFLRQNTYTLLYLYLPISLSAHHHSLHSSRTHLHTFFHSIFFIHNTIQQAVYIDVRSRWWMVLVWRTSSSRFFYKWWWWLHLQNLSRLFFSLLGEEASRNEMNEPHKSGTFLSRSCIFNSPLQHLIFLEVSVPLIIIFLKLYLVGDIYVLFNSILKLQEKS